MWERPRTTFPVPWQIPWAAGRTYSHTLGTTIGSASLNGLSVYISPIYVPNQIAINSMGIEVTSGVTGSRVRCALYEYIEEGLMGRLVIDSGTFFTTTAGHISTPVSKVLNQGWYQAALVGQGISVYNWYTDGELNLVRGAPTPLNIDAVNWVTRIVIAANDSLNILSNGFPTYFSNNPTMPLQVIGSANALRLLIET